MKNTIITLSIAALSAMAANAAVITPEQALARVQSSRNHAAAMTGKASRLVHTEITAQGNPAIYVFERADSDNGYLLLSADDIAYPVLGYADEGRFDADNMAPAMKWWLDQYAAQIEYASTHGNSKEGIQSALLTRSRAGREAIAPMIKSHWDQVAPFNDQCPLMGAERTYTGCVATAMAQVMNYWKYPEIGTGSISYTAEDIQKKLTMNFAAKPFDWDNMIDDYIPGQYNDTQAEAVAYLMKACGYAVRMNYSNDASGALAMYIRRGMTYYFNYDENAVYTLRDYHSASEWEDLIYDNLKNVGPILYGGSSNVGGGHSFVCDGYSTDGLFHFNWGWTGMSDGYFALSALNPDALGTGGGTGGGYNFDQDALLGIQPPTGKPIVPQPERITQMGSLTAKMADTSTLALGLDVQSDPMWVNYNSTTQNIYIGAKFAPASGNGEATCVAVRNEAVRLQPGYGISSAAVNAKIKLDELNLADGDYKVSFVTITKDNYDDATAADWLDPHTFYGYTTEATLTKAGNEYKVNYTPAPQLRIANAEFSTELFYQCLQKVKVEIANDSDIELTSGFAPLLAIENQLVMLGESVSISVAPHSTVTREWTTQLYDLVSNMSITQDTQMLLTFLDEITFSVLSQQCLKPVTMKANPGSPKLTITDTPTVKNATMGTYDEGSYVATVAKISNPYQIEVSIPLSLSKGYCAYNIAAALCEFADDNHDQVGLIAIGASPLFLDNRNSNPFRPTIMEATVDVITSYPLMESGKFYPLICGYMVGDGLYPLSGGNALYITLGEMGVENVVAAEKAINVKYDSAAALALAEGESTIIEMTAHDVSGRCVASSASAVLDLSGINSGLLIVTARDAAGNTASVKINK